ncbi:MAG: thioredoxin domain-containing protein, partial [Rhodospirillaceae bacterium]|nr:thioredoxin domain-containing protein [Rhodospirillaceae bacterium]
MPNDDAKIAPFIVRTLLFVGVILAVAAFPEHAQSAQPCKFATTRAESPAGNCLDRESSPYLLAHAKDPVNWRPWSQDALDEARVTGRLIFLSIGYSACHWCHVMQRDNFEDADTARLMNRHYVNVLIDREERPDIDQRYQMAATAMDFPTGWPLNLVLTPEGLPIFAGTYFPPEQRQGMPAFSKILRTCAKIKREDPDALAAQSSKVVAYLQNVAAT